MSYRSGHHYSDHHHHPHPQDHGRTPPRRPAPHAAKAVAVDGDGYTIVHAGKQVRLGPVVFWIVVGTLVVNTFFMALGFFAALLYLAHRLQRADGWLLVAIYFIVLEFVIVTALALLFSSFSSPLLSAVFAFAGLSSSSIRVSEGLASLSPRSRRSGGPPFARTTGPWQGGLYFITSLRRCWLFPRWSRCWLTPRRTLSRKYTSASCSTAPSSGSS